MEPQSIEPAKRGVPSRLNHYNKVIPYFDEVLDKMVALMRESKNENIAFAAAKWLGDKIVPDLQAIKHEGEVTMRLPQVWIPKEKDNG